MTGILHGLAIKGVYATAFEDLDEVVYGFLLIYAFQLQVLDFIVLFEKFILEVFERILVILLSNIDFGLCCLVTYLNQLYQIDQAYIVSFFFYFVYLVLKGVIALKVLHIIE